MFRESASSLIRLAIKARRWYSPDTLVGILKEIKDDLEPLDRDRMARFVCHLCIFVPSSTLDNEEIVKLLEPCSLVWKGNCKRFEALLLNLLARMARNGRAIPANHVQFYLGLMTRALKLPQPEDNEQDSERILYRHKTSLGMVKNQFYLAPKAFARFIIYAMINDPTGRALESFRSFLIGLDSYCHPSNFGGWTDQVSMLISSCAHYMALAISRDATISTDMKRNFVDILWPGMKKLSFSKNQFIMLNCTGSARYLEFIYPGIVSIDIIRSAMISMYSLCEPHRTLSNISVLARLSRLHLESLREDSPSNPDTSLLGLLPEFVVGLDPNDAFKTATSINLFASVLTCLSLSPSNILSTEYLETFVIRLIETSLLYIDSITAQSVAEAESNALDRSIMKGLGHFWDILFHQMSEELWELAFKKVEQYFLQAGSSGSSPYVSRLARACKGRYPEKAITKMLPVLMDRINEGLKHGSGADSRQSDEACGSLIWYLSCLKGLLRYSFDTALPYSKDLLQLLVTAISEVKQPTCHQLVGKIIKSCVFSWADWYPKCPDNTVKSVRIRDFSTTWHEPSEKGIHSAKVMINTIIGQLCDGIQDSNAEDSKAKLTILKGTIQAASISFTIGDNELVKTVQCTCLGIAESTKAPVEIRKLALDVLSDSLRYHGIGENQLAELRRSCHTWMLMMRNYPKQKDHQVLIHSQRCLVSHRHWNYFVKNSKAHMLSTQFINAILALSLGPYSVIRMYMLIMVVLIV